MCLFLATAALADAPQFQPVATSTQLMDAMIIPASNALFDADVKAPKNDQDWAKPRTNALILAEAGNLLMMRAEDNGNWMKYSRMLVAAGKAAIRAVDAKDLDKLNDNVDEQVMESCEVCHEQYLDKGKKK